MTAEALGFRSMRVADPDYIVIRGTNSRFDGCWYDRATFRQAPTVESPDVVLITLEPTGEFEVRDTDGAVAEVWRPLAAEALGIEE